ncbi:hypothetical protein D3C80_1767360 [compost metagenome]
MIQGQWFRHFTFNFERPRIGFHTACVGGRVRFIQAKLIKIVVTGDFIFRRERQFILPLCGLGKIQRLPGGGFGAVIAFKPIKQVGMSGGGKGKRGGADTEHLQDLAAL